MTGSSPGTSRKHRKRLSRWTKLWIALGVLVLLAVACWFVLDAASRYALKKQLAAARATGDPLTFEEIFAAQEPLPDEQNGALVLRALFDRLEPFTDPEAEELRTVPIVGKRRWPRVGEPFDAGAEEAAREFLAQHA